MRGGVAVIAVLVLATKCGTKHPDQEAKKTTENETAPAQAEVSKIAVVPAKPPCHALKKDGVLVQVPGQAEECETDADADETSEEVGEIDEETKPKPDEVQTTEEIPVLAWAPCVGSDQFKRPQVATVDLDNTPMHIGQLMTPGHTSVFIIGAEWCGPCKKLKKELPSLAKEFPDVMFTYINTGGKDSKQALVPFHEGNKINDLPYAYVVNSCGVGLAWLVVDNQMPLTGKIRKKLIKIQKL